MRKKKFVGKIGNEEIKRGDVTVGTKNPGNEHETRINAKHENVEIIEMYKINRVNY